MNLSNAGIIRQNSSTSTRQSAASGQQQQPPVAGSWRCEVFVDVSYFFYNFILDFN